MPTVRELLNRLRWGPQSGPDTVVLAVRVREGAMESIEDVEFASVIEILPGGVTVADGTFLPYHRLVSVKRGEEVLWHSSRG
jgi:uncharacterized protein (UPF0248 family)